MKKYEKPQLELNELEVSDIITVSNVFKGIADPENVIKEDFTQLIAVENW